MVRRVAVITGAIVVVAVIVVLVRPFQPAGGQVETATVTRGSLEATVELAGSVTPRDSRSLGFGTVGTVASVAVRAGDTVRAGQVLASLDDGVAQTQVRAAQAALASAAARLAADRAGLTAAQLAQARDPVTQAAAALDAARAGETAARAQRDATVAAAAATLEQAEAQLAADTTNGAAETILGLDRLAVEAARANLDSVAQQGAGAVAQAAAAVSSARAALTAAQHAYEVRTAPAPEAVIAADEAAVASAEASLAAARQALTLASIISPIAGTVTDVGFRIGDRIGSVAGGVGAAPVGAGATEASGRIVVQDLSDLDVRATASEIDIVSLTIGQSATVTFDALTGLAIGASICDLGRTGSTSQGVVEYPLTLCLTSADERLRAGMSANVSIVLARADDVLVVPSPAVRTLDGRSVVRVLQPDGAIREVEVQVGISSGTRLEIRSGLAEGDRVVVGGATTGSGG